MLMLELHCSALLADMYFICAAAVAGCRHLTVLQVLCHGQAPLRLLCPAAEGVLLPAHTQVTAGVLTVCVSSAAAEDGCRRSDVVRNRDNQAAIWTTGKIKGVSKVRLLSAVLLFFLQTNIACSLLLSSCSLESGYPHRGRRRLSMPWGQQAPTNIS